ncbi:MAG: hypothetical protein ACHREM_24000 [Polyangiales bacterium]
MASTSSPIIPASWTVPNWFIDPANSATCASNTNSGTAATCTGGCTGSTCPSGIGPLVSYQELSTHRWGTYSPRLRQTTTLTWLSSQTTSADAVYFSPLIENGSTVLLTGALGAGQQVGAACTLSAVTAKNRATPQLLTATGAGVGCTFATGQLVRNNTHTSYAWTWAAVAGNSWNFTQPIAPMLVPTTTFSPAEVDTWTIGDSITIFNPVQAYIVSLNPTNVDNGGTEAALYLTHLATFTVNGAGADDNLELGAGSIIFEEAAMLRAVSGLWQEAAVSSAAFNTNFQNWLDVNVTWPNVYSVIGGQVNAFFSQSGGMQFDGDVYLGQTGGGSFAFRVNGGLAGCFYINAGTTLTMEGALVETTSTYNSNVAVVWGPGAIDLAGTTRWQYPSGAGQGATLFKLTGGLQINSQTKGCIAQPGAGTIGACNTAAATGANLDTANGATVGCLVALGGGAFCNYGP